MNIKFNSPLSNKQRSAVCTEPPNPSAAQAQHSCYSLKTVFLEYRVAAMTTMSFILFLPMFAIILLLLKPNTVCNANDGLNPAKSTESSDLNTTLTPTKLQIVTRSEWLAQPPTESAISLKTPVPYVIISHTATENCSSQAQCVFQVRFIQTFHMETRGWWDIGYNFLVGGDGKVYFGRGWDKEGVHTRGHNNNSIGISLIGTFTNSKPSENQLIACKDLIERGVELGYISPDYVLVGARQFIPTISPGEELYKEIQTWPHWSITP